MRTLAILGIATLVGCAGVTHEPVPEGGDAKVDGIRYYGSSWYLLVYSNGNGGVKWELKQLPDPTKLMVARPSRFLSSLKMTLEFKDGVLTSSKATADSTAVPKEILAAAQTVATALIKTLESGPPSETREPFTMPAPSLWRVVPKGDTIEFQGQESNEVVRVTRPQVNPS